MPRHSALCHDSGVRRYVTNKVRCMHDKGALPRMTEELCRLRKSRALTTGMRARVGCSHNRGASATEVFYRDIDFSIATNLYISHKKKRPWEIRASHEMPIGYQALKGEPHKRFINGKYLKKYFPTM